MRASSCNPAWPKGSSRSRKSKSRGVVLLMGADSTVSGVSSQPNSVVKRNYLSGMNIYDGKTVLWANVKARMLSLYGKENLTRLVSESGIGPGTATRIKEQSTSVGIDVLEKIAKPLKVQPWELLNPALSSTAPEVVDARFEALRRIYSAVRPEDRNGAISAAMIAMSSFMPESSQPTPEPTQIDSDGKPSAARQAVPTTSKTQ